MYGYHLFGTILLILHVKVSLKVAGSIKRDLCSVLRKKQNGSLASLKFNESSHRSDLV